MRGKLEYINPLIERGRITPAGAGKTIQRFRNECTARDHPRRCGENLKCCQPEPAKKGSPPQVRGKLSQSPRDAELNRITPAGAGKTTHRGLMTKKFEDHPRRCGENVNRFLGEFKNIGSPPQVRGKRFSRLRKTSRHGITPAGAGKTQLTPLNIANN